MPIRSRAEYTTYSFTATAAIDYNYDPSPDNEGFDPYSDDTSSSPLRQCPPPPMPIQPRIPTSPSSQYLAESQKPSTQLPTPSASRKLLILDLNGTLVYRTPHVRREFRPRRKAHHNGRYPDLSPTTPGYDDPYADPKAPRSLRTVHARPYMRSFREYLFHPRTRAWLDTMVWSSAQPHSVADMVDKCFESRRDELVAVWARDTLGLEEKDYHQKTQTTKDLARPWSKLRLPLRPLVTPIPSLSPSPSSSLSPLPLPSPSSSSSPSTPTPTPQSHAEAHSAHTTLLLDDSPRKAHLQPYNHLCIREYSGTLRNADLQVRAAAAAAERRGRGEEEEEAHIASSSSSSSARLYTTGVGVGVGDPNATYIPPPALEGTDTKKRKRVNKKNVTTHHLPSDDGSGGDGGGGGEYTGYDYDPTLLAVIGVLERIKWEANVAGWMRAGGLRTALPLKVQVQVQVLGKGKGKARAGSVVDDAVGAGAGAGADVATESGVGRGSEMKKRRLGVEGEYPGRESEELEELEEPERGGGGGGEVPPAVGPGEIGDTGQWFEDAAALGHWVRAGVRALEGLGVEVWPGVEG